MRSMLLLILVPLGQLAETAMAQEDCGVSCLFVAIHSLDEASPVRHETLLASLKPGTQGNTMAELENEAKRVNFHATPVRTTLRALQVRERPFACIAHLKKNHYVLLTDVLEGSVRIADPPQFLEVPVASFLNEWDGTALLISKGPLEPEEAVSNRLWWADFRYRCMIWGLSGLGLCLALVGFRSLRGKRVGGGQ